MFIRHFFTLTCLLSIVSCAGSDGESDTGPMRPASNSGCTETEWTSRGATISRLCHGISLSLTPGIQLDGGWVNATECVKTDGRFDCVLDGIGRLQVSTDGNRLTSSFVASKDLVFEGHGFRGTLNHPGAIAWLSNGFQSWSQSGIISIPPSVTTDVQHQVI